MARLVSDTSAGIIACTAAWCAETTSRACWEAVWIQIDAASRMEMNSPALSCIICPPGPCHDTAAVELVLNPIWIISASSMSASDWCAAPAPIKLAPRSPVVNSV